MMMPLPSPCSGHDKDFGAAGGAAEEHAEHQRSPRNHQDAEDGARQAAAGAAADAGQSKSHSFGAEVSKIPV